jgi:hypothetical protein
MKTYDTREIPQLDGDTAGWLRRFARLGFAAKGIVYVVVGVLAAQTALGRGGSTTDTRGALHAIAAQPFGSVLLAIVAAGLFGYALWRLAEAVLDPEHHGSDTSGRLKRAGYVVIGLVYGTLAISAVRILMNRGQQGNAEQAWTARLLSQPFGKFLVGAVALAIIGYGLGQLWKAYTADFRKKLRLGELGAQNAEWAVRLGRFGRAARGVVLGLAGMFVLQAALRSDPETAGGLDKALQALAQQRYGSILLGIAAAGLIAYGISMLIEARYRAIRVE